MITKIRPFPDVIPDWWVPKLHDITVSKSAPYGEMNQWCEENCKSKFYFYPSWSPKHGAQFEDSDDADNFRIWASLTWL